VLSRCMQSRTAAGLEGLLPEIRDPGTAIRTVLAEQLPSLSRARTCPWPLPVAASFAAVLGGSVLSVHQDGGFAD
jgi:hypothetical protein